MKGTYLPGCAQPHAKADSTRASQAVPHPSTDRALRHLTSEFGRDPVHSTRYGRQRREVRQTRHMNTNSPKRPKPSGTREGNTSKRGRAKNETKEKTTGCIKEHAVATKSQTKRGSPKRRKTRGPGEGKNSKKSARQKTEKNTKRQDVSRKMRSRKNRENLGPQWGPGKKTGNCKIFESPL